MPWLLRPPFLGWGLVSDFSGRGLILTRSPSFIPGRTLILPSRPLSYLTTAKGLRPEGFSIRRTVPSQTVSSAKSLTVPWRRPGVVGLYLRMPMTPSRLSEELDRRAVGVQGDDGLLPVGQPAHAEA